eukprot:TRINITY_DN514_c0_g3_i6.p1 TRINITY_DN514_c0_g3~~TRINITY_DN514_c0_g3_i6.p1  ORF type:complete len:157 (-),score=21.63 TRINITY_DN514_c0_g3_i6:155-625(-)
MSSPKTSSAAILRLMSDLKQIRHNPPEGVSASPVSDENMFVWEATIFGPEETPWEGGIYSLRLSFSEQYPSKPPKVRFISDMYHPNVYADGTLCLDIIQDNWSPIYSVSSILTSIQSLLSDPNPASPANPDAGQCYLNDREKYNKLVRRCASRTLE